MPLELELARHLAARLREADPMLDQAELKHMLELGHDERSAACAISSATRPSSPR